MGALAKNITMEELLFKHYSAENQVIEKYLSQSIVNYGLAQHKHDNPEKLFCTCKNNSGTLYGAVMGTKTLDMFFISHIFVEENHRNKGIGSLLLAEIQEKATKLGCSIIRLNTFNNLSHYFYSKNGFNETTRINNYMNGFDLVYYDKRIS